VSYFALRSAGKYAPPGFPCQLWKRELQRTPEGCTLGRRNSLARSAEALNRHAAICFPTFVNFVCIVNNSPAADDDLDRALVRRFLDGERPAGDELVNRYHRSVFNVALRMLGNVQDAEDVSQTVFGNAFLALDSYDPKYRFFSWIYRMTVNESLNTINRRRNVVSLDGSIDVPAPDTVSHSAAEAEARVGSALLELKPDDRAVVVLRHFVSFSYEEISDVLDVPVKTVKSRLFTARERLRQSLLVARA
jgi:RNA polymerase sigma-70 factor, ECF subfamily